jgi:hypothetical protein
MASRDTGKVYLPQDFLDVDLAPLEPPEDGPLLRRLAFDQEEQTLKGDCAVTIKERCARSSPITAIEDG